MRRRLPSEEPEHRAGADESAPDVTVEPAALQSDALAAPGSQALRVSVMRQAQQGLGNAAVGRILSREPNPALEDTKAPPEPKVKHKTGAEVDAYLDASPFFKKLVADAVKAGKKAEGHVHIHAPDKFKEAWAAYAKGKTNPDTGATFTDAEITSWEAKVNAFQDKTEIHVHQDRGEPGTTVHESMHLFAHADWLPKVGFNCNEGATEYFTKKLCAENKIPRGDFYADQHKSVKKLAGYVGEDVLAAAYFNGKLAELEAAVDKKAGDKAGTWTKWLGYVKGSKYADADAML